MIRSIAGLKKSARTAAVGVTVLATAGLVTSGAQAQQAGSSVVKSAATDLHISADSAPFHLQLDGDTGSFTQQAFGGTGARRYSVSYLHSQPGPTGYSKHLVWLLARDAKGFNVLWCYLDDAGKDFWCWLYRYPENVLTTQKFTGDYKFTVPPRSQESVEPGFSLVDVPAYTGPNFVFPGWTRKSGTIQKLDIFTPPVITERSPTAVANREVLPDQKPVRTLENLDVHPLHQLMVGAANGWRTGGWEELHNIAFDANHDPYYLILYTNSRRGFVVDVKRSMTYTADFGSKVAFNDDPKEFGPKSIARAVADTPSVKRNQPYELSFTSQKQYENPYTDVLLDIELVGPDRRTIRVPGYWDGGKTWKMRFAPPKVGTWTWKTFSTDKDLDGKLGVVECAPESDPTTGFFHVHPYRSQSRHFAVGQSTPFYPSFIYDPVISDPLIAANTGARAAGLADVKTPASFTAFQARMDALHAAGFNRLTGGYLVNGDTSIGEPKNEGGSPFIGGDFGKLNPEFFNWMERRIAYCNSLGMIPDVGIAKSTALTIGAGKDAQLRQLWRYVLARFSSYDVCWNLFGPVPADSAEALAKISPFAQMAGRFDLFHHPLTTDLIVTDDYIKKAAAAVAPNKATAGARNPSPTLDGPVLGLPMWLSYASVKLQDPKTVYSLLALKKPIVVSADVTAGSTTEDAARATLWGSRMRLGYYTTNVVSGPAPAVDSLLEKQVAICDTFFKQTHYSRLEPHMEMLNAREESPEQRRRRHLANIQAGVPVETGDPIGTADPNASPTAVLLSDPAREYVLYFFKGGNVNIDLLEATGHIKVFWFNPRTGEMKEDIQIVGGTYHAFAAPDNKDWVLYLKRVIPG